MSTLKTNTLSNAAGSKSVPVDTVVSGTAKAWVNFNGTGTVAIRQAFNVTSITDNGTGDYTVNFTAAMADSSYGVSYALNGGDTVSTRYGINIHGPSQASAPTLMSASQLRVLCGVTHTTGVSDHHTVCVSIFR